MTFEAKPIYVEIDEDNHSVFKSESGESVRVLKDSISEYGHRLTTMELRFYRGVLAEFNTHRVFSRNSASSRAVPVLKMIKSIMEDPYIPEYWGAYQKGMQASREISNPEDKKATWLEGRDRAVRTALELLYGEKYTPYLRDNIELPVAIDVLSCHDIPEDAPHKQIVNRVLEPYMWHTVIVTATEYMNFFDLRAHSDADPAIQQIAYQMVEAYNASLPEPVEPGQWHLPLMQEDEINAVGLDMAKKISSARCARVSYLTHDGTRDFSKDLDLYKKLVEGKPHASPLEHVATPARDGEYILGNFSGWHQFRGEVFGGLYE